MSLVAVTDGTPAQEQGLISGGDEGTKQTDGILRPVWTGDHNTRMQSLMERGFGSDLVLAVGSSHFKVHKLLLQVASPVLYSQIVHTPERLEVANSEEAYVKLLLEYIYMGKSSLTVDQSIGLLPLAQHYEMEHLSSVCLSNLQRKFNANEAIKVLNVALKFNQQELVETAKDIVVRWAFHLLPSQEFVDISPDALLLLLQQDDLNVAKEVDLFNAVLRWGYQQLGKHESGTITLKTLLADHLKLIRFPLIDLEETAAVVEPAKVMDSEELTSLMCFQILNAKEGQPRKYALSYNTSRRNKIPLTLCRDANSTTLDPHLPKAEVTLQSTLTLTVCSMSFPEPVLAGWEGINNQSIADCIQLQIKLKRQNGRDAESTWTCPLALADKMFVAKLPPGEPAFNVIKEVPYLMSTLLMGEAMFGGQQSKIEETMGLYCCDHNYFGCHQNVVRLSGRHHGIVQEVRIELNE